MSIAGNGKLANESGLDVEKGRKRELRDEMGPARQGGGK